MDNLEKKISESQQITRIDYDVGVLIKDESMGQDFSDNGDKNFAGRGWFFGGVYDGHGYFDGGMANTVWLQLPAEFEESLLSDQSKELSSELVKSSFEKAYNTISQRLLRYTDSRGGTMAVNAFIAYPNLYIAHAGDSKGVVCVNDKLIYATKDHTDERGKYYRALGHSNKESRPDVYYTSLHELLKQGTIRVVLFSDGILEGMNIQTEYQMPRIASIVSGYENAQKSAEALMEETNSSLDDRVVMVVRLIPRTQHDIEKEKLKSEPLKREPEIPKREGVIRRLFNKWKK